MLYNKGDAGQTAIVTLECGVDTDMATLIDEDPPSQFNILLKSFGACRSVCQQIVCFGPAK